MTEENLPASPKRNRHGKPNTGQGDGILPDPGGPATNTDPLKKRLAELKLEFEAGQKMLNDLDAKRSDLAQTLLRISGAIQVLEELIAADPPKE